MFSASDTEVWAAWYLAGFGILNGKYGSFYMFCLRKKWVGWWEFCTLGFYPPLFYLSLWVRNMCLHFEPFSVCHTHYLIPQSSPCLMQNDMKSYLKKGWDVFCIWTLRGLWDREQPPTAGNTGFLHFMWRKVCKGQLRLTSAVPCRLLLQRSCKIWNLCQRRGKLFYATTIRRHTALRETACYKILWIINFFWQILILVPYALDFRQGKRNITQRFSPISSQWPVRISKK